MIENNYWPFVLKNNLRLICMFVNVTFNIFCDKRPKYYTI